jgi:hypothetical protein
MSMKSVGFGWELIAIDNYGANLYVPINAAITILGIQMDVAYMPTYAPASQMAAEILCTAQWVSGTPTFSSDAQAYVNGPTNTDFGEIPGYGGTLFAPSGHTAPVGSFGPGNMLASAILKTWVSTTPTASATARSVSNMGLNIVPPTGSYLVFHMDHLGIPGNVEMQGVLFYQ